MTGISLIIVSYKVKYFLRQCLQSIQASDCQVPVEIYVVDNLSQDGSVDMVATEFPDVHLIANQENVGFGKANNQAIKKATGQYTLILNPDTILQEHTLQACYDHMEAHDKAGAVGVQMVDGAGKVLPESKRGFPTPLNALFKMTGLNKLFPKSAFFNGYYAGHLEDDKPQQVSVLTGAFLFARTEVLQQIGGFDEDYFMYGEDIELSYQIQEAGHEVHYLPTERIIHFKGESTNKLSWDYTKRFYGAMGIYASKRESGSGIWKLFIKLGIVLSAIKGLFSRLFQTLLRPMVDVGLLYTVFLGVKMLWSRFYMGDINYYQGPEFNWLGLGLIILSVAVYGVFGQYDRRHNLKHLFFSFVVSTFLLLSCYSLMPSDFRFSRFIIILLCIAMPVLLAVSRAFYNKLSLGSFSFDSVSAKRVGIVADAQAYGKLQKLVTKYSGAQSLIGRIALNEVEDALGHLDDIKHICNSREINELIFSSQDLNASTIFELMGQLDSAISYKIADNDSQSILGSDSKERVGEWYTYDIGHKIDQPFHRRTKRLIDMGFCIISILLFPLALLSPNRGTIFSNLFKVLLGQKTWQGYDERDADKESLPVIKSAVFVAEGNMTDDRYHDHNLFYARQFSTWNELASLLNILVRERTIN